MKKSDGVALSISMIIGISAGAVIAYFTNHWELLIGIGLSIGMAAGVMIEHFKKKAKN